MFTYRTREGKEKRGKGREEGEGVPEGDGWKEGQFSSTCGLKSASSKDITADSPK
jgi:hypothetical protein